MSSCRQQPQNRLEQPVCFLGPRFCRDWNWLLTALGQLAAARSLLKFSFSP
jgi:hypothetical protein